MKNIDLLHKTFRTLVFNIQIKLEEDPDNNYLKGMLDGFRVGHSLVDAWEIETNNVEELFEDNSAKGKVIGDQ
jgi:hypothetical protein